MAAARPVLGKAPLSAWLQPGAEVVAGVAGQDEQSPGGVDGRQRRGEAIGAGGGQGGQDPGASRARQARRPLV
jgi:hypothetical protein